MKNRKVLGFTLIELLIVIAIIGILAVAFLPSLLNAPAKGRDAQRVATIQKLEGFLVTQMLADISSLPATGCITEPADAADTTSIGGMVRANIAGFGGVFPADPDKANKTGTCTGSYGYVKFQRDLAAVNYSAGVYITVENSENANYTCTDGTAIPDDADPALTPGVGTCYVALLQ